jgi:hypothetical protein
MSFLDVIKTAVGVGIDMIGPSTSSIVNTVVSIPGSVIDKSLPDSPAIVSVPGKIIEDLAKPVLQVVAPTKELEPVTIEPVKADRGIKLKVPGYEEGSDKTTTEELMELLPMAGLGLLAFLL